MFLFRHVWWYATILPVLALSVADLPSICAADAPLKADIKPEGFTVELPTGWDRDKTVAAIYPYVGASIVRTTPYTSRFILTWTPTDPKGQPPHNLAISSVVTRAGEYRLELTNSAHANDTQYVDFSRSSSSDGKKYEFGSRKTQAVANPSAASLFQLGGDTSSHVAVASEVGEKPGDVATLVMTEAAHWDSTGVEGRRPYVKKHDMHPITSCRTIAGILRETADDLAKAPSNYAEIDKAMKNKLEGYYKSQDSDLRKGNPLRDDWQPFLEYLRKRLSEKYSEATLEDPKFAQYVLREVADGFDQLGQVWLKAATEGLPDNGSGRPSESGSYSGGITGNSLPNTTQCRCRKRCHCARLLFVR